MSENINIEKHSKLGKISFSLTVICSILAFVYLNNLYDYMSAAGLWDTNIATHGWLYHPGYGETHEGTGAVLFFLYLIPAIVAFFSIRQKDYKIFLPMLSLKIIALAFVVTFIARACYYAYYVFTHGSWLNF